METTYSWETMSTMENNQLRLYAFFLLTKLSILIIFFCSEVITKVQLLMKYLVSMMNASAVTVVICGKYSMIALI